MATGLQAAQLGLVRLLEAWRDEQLTAREYTTLLDLQARWIERELKRELETRADLRCLKLGPRFIDPLLEAK